MPPVLPSNVQHGCLALLLCGLAAANAAEDPGTPVKVTSEMRGAGIVSSGVALPALPPVTGSRKAPVASWGKPLPYPIVIADRRNNRLIEVTPDKRIVWEFASPNLKVYRGNEDVNFSHDGRKLAVSEEDNYDVHIVDVESRTLEWTFGEPDVRGNGQRLNYPDDAHLLEDGQLPDGRHPQLPRADHRPQEPAGSPPNGAAAATAGTTRPSGCIRPTAPRRWTTATSW
jgi:hypothetical protein